jgi:YVTN family beta-propeller protein
MLKRQLNQPFSISSEAEESAQESPAKVTKTAETLAKLAEDLAKTAEVGDLAEVAQVLAKKAKVFAKTALIKAAENLAKEAEERAETAEVLAQEEEDSVLVAEFRARAVWCHAEADRMYGRETILILREERRRVTVWDQIQEEKKKGKYPTFCSDSICSNDESFAVLQLVLLFLEAEAKAADDRQAVAYVVNSTSGTISVIDTVSHAVIETIPVGYDPSAVAITPNGTEAYVPNGDNTVSVINTASHAVTGTIKVGERCPRELTISPDGTRAYLINLNRNFSSDTISVIDMVRHVVITTIEEEEDLMEEGKEDFTEVAITPDGTRIYVICEVTVIIIDTDSNQVIDTMEVGGYLYAVAITPDGTKLYVANSDKNTVIAIDTASHEVIATIPVGEKPQHIAITPDGTKVYVTNQVSATVSVIATANHVVIATIKVGDWPAGIAISRRLTWQ